MNSFIKNAFLNYAVKMCLCVKHTPRAENKTKQNSPFSNREYDHQYDGLVSYYQAPTPL